MAVLTKRQNEYTILNGGNSKINNIDLYNFATKVLEPICERNFVYGGIKAKVKTKASTGRGGSDFHRAAFKVTATSLSDGSKETFSVLCKMYKEDSVTDEVTIDYQCLMGGYYKYIATIIAGTVYYLRMDDIYAYQEMMGNACVTPNGQFIRVNAEYFIDYAEYRTELNATDKAEYERGYERYVTK